MSTPAYVDSETITQADRAQRSRVPIPLPDDPYVAVRQAQLVGTDTESDPEEAPSEVEEFLPLVSRAPITDEEFEVLEPSDTRITPSHSSASSDSTDRTYGRAYPAKPIPRHVSRIAEAAALSPSSFRKRYRSSYETSSSLSLTLPTRKRYQGTSELILDTETKDESSDLDAEREGHGLDDEGHGLDDEGHGLDDEGHGLDDEGHGLEDEGPGTEEEEEEVAPEGQQQAVQVVDTAVDKTLGLGYGAARHRALESTGEIAPSTYEVRQSSRSVLKHDGAERVSAFRQPTLVTWVDPEDGRVC
ncbi:hypothetical protein Tco_1462462, partial [Tanacetum coccineum]